MLLVMVFNGSSAVQLSVLRIFRHPLIGRMFEVQRLNWENLVLLEGTFASLRESIAVGNLLTINSYAFAH